MAQFIEFISEVPVVGPWIKIIILLIPPGIVIGWLNIDHLSIISLICAAWLLVLEKWLGIRTVVPLIKIPWLWICGVGIVAGLFIT